MIHNFDTFQFTTSRGGRQSHGGLGLLIKAFQFTNSRGGRPELWRSVWTCYQLSIHDLSGRSTDARPEFYCQGCLSIHDLSGRSTFVSAAALANTSAFQFTTSRGGRLNPSSPAVLCRTFQFTTSRGGRQLETPTPTETIALSIHDLSGRSTFSSFNFCLLFGLSIHDLSGRSTFPRISMLHF